MSLTKLPDEIILKICDYLNLKDITSVRSTCTRLFDISQESKGYSEIKLCLATIKFGKFWKLIKPQTTSIKIFHCCMLTPQALPTQLSLENMKWIELVRIDFNNSEFLMIELISNCKNLQILILQTFEVDITLSDAMMNNQKLEQICLFGCTFPPTFHVPSFFNSFKFLVELNLNFSYFALNVQIYDIFEYLAEKLEGLSLASNNFGFNDEWLQNMDNPVQSLKKLKLIGFDWFDHISVDLIGSKFPNLEELDIVDSDTVDLASYLMLKDFNNLKKLNLHRDYDYYNEEISWPESISINQDDITVAQY